MKIKSIYSKAVIVLLFSTVLISCVKDEPLYEDKGSVYFTSTATFDQMVPAPTTASTGTAEVLARFDNNSKVFNYWIKWKDMSSLVTKASFYFPSTTVQNGWLERNMFTASTPRPVVDSASGYIFSNTSLSDQEVADMKAGKVYFQVVTQTNTGGEIRGYLKVKTK
ncbi:MAG: CHRD domain-containing protein [Lacibacter sp.]